MSKIELRFCRKQQLNHEERHPGTKHSGGLVERLAAAAASARVSRFAERALVIGRERLLSFPFTVQGGITVKVLLDYYASLGLEGR